ncbi:MAG: AmiS/UreI family transporter [Nostocoides sp.]
MSSVGLLYVGAVLFINGCGLLGLVRGTGTVPMNVFVGLLQAITPTWLIMSSGGDPDVIFGASGLFLFSFTYLYVAWNAIWGTDPTGVGYFSLFVAIAAVAYALVNIIKYQDYAFGVIWLLWAVLWALFFLLLGLGREHLTRVTGAVALVEGWTTAAIPAFLLLIGWWSGKSSGVLAGAVAVVTVLGVAVVMAAAPKGADPDREGAATG